VRWHGGGAMFGQAAGLAVLAALSPPALLIAAVYLSSASPRKLAAVYLVGAAAMTVAAGVVILVALRAGGLSLPANRHPRYGLRLGLGVLSLAAAGYLAWRYRHRHPSGSAKPGRIARMTAHPRPVTALAVGIVVFAPGAGFIAAVQAIATAKASLAATVGALVLVVVIDLAFAWLPLLLHLIAPGGTTRTLKAINTWLSAHGRALMPAALAAIGIILLIDGATGLA
jgi:Sap, sulfolipid-1-addressing protein